MRQPTNYWCVRLQASLARLIALAETPFIGSRSAMWLTFFVSLMVMLGFGLTTANAQYASELLANGPMTAEGFVTDTHADFVPGELVVGLYRSHDGQAARAYLQSMGIVKACNPAIESCVVQIPPFASMEEAALFLSSIPGVRYVEPNYIAFALATPNDPSYGLQYGLHRIQVNLAWDVWRPQRATYIAIIDTGVAYSHPDLANKLRRRDGGTVYGWNTLDDTPNAEDDHGHGTHCAGIAAAQINNGIGVAGVAGWNPADPNAQRSIQIMPVKVLNAGGFGTHASVASGITWAVDNGAHVLSLSLGSYSSSQQLEDAVNYAWNRGRLIVAAAGNGGSSQMHYPAAYTNCVAVAATDSSDRLTWFSQYGAWVDIAAPGQDVFSTIPDGYAYMSGTSMACPFVSGAAALAWSHAPYLTNLQLRNILETNVDPYQPYDGRTIAPNAGRLNVNRALRVARPPSLDTLQLNPTSVVGGQSSTGTVTLNAPAGSGAGQTSATFQVRTRAVTARTQVHITASAGGTSRVATLTVNPVSLTSLALNPTSVVGGQSSTGTVTLNAPAGSGGFTVQLSSDNTSVATVPSSVTVRAGQTSATFQVRTRAVTARTQVHITASVGRSSRKVTLTVIPPSLVSLTLNPTSVQGGSSSKGVITLSGPAPAGGIVVHLGSSDSRRAKVPASVTVAEGKSAASFTVRTTAGSTTTVTITANYNGDARSASLEIRQQ